MGIDFFGGKKQKKYHVTAHSPWGTLNFTLLEDNGTTAINKVLQEIYELAGEKSILNQTIEISLRIVK